MISDNVSWKKGFKYLLVTKIIIKLSCCLYIKYFDESKNW